MKTRIYSVAHGNTVRLVRSTSNLHALHFACKGVVNVTAVKKDELADLLQKGMKIEDATGGKQEEIPMENQE